MNSGVTCSQLAKLLPVSLTACQVFFRQVPTICLVTLQSFSVFAWCRKVVEFDFEVVLIHRQSANYHVKPLGIISFP